MTTWYMIELLALVTGLVALALLYAIGRAKTSPVYLPKHNGDDHLVYMTDGEGPIPVSRLRGLFCRHRTLRHYNRWDSRPKVVARTGAPGKYAGRACAVCGHIDYDKRIATL